MATQTVHNSYIQSPEDEAVYADYLKNSQAPAPQPQIVEQAANVPVPPSAPKQPDKLAEMELEMARQRRENEELKYNLELWKTQLNKQNQPVPKIQSIQEDEAMTRGVYEDDVGNRMRQLEQQIADLQFKVTETGVSAKYSDYDEVVEKYTVPLVQQKPHLREGIQNASNKPLFAYELGKMQREIERSQQEIQSMKSQHSYQQAPSQAQASVNSPGMRMLENAMKPGSLSMTGGQGTFIPKVVDYASMSDAEFEAVYKANTRDH